MKKIVTTITIAGIAAALVVTLATGSIRFGVGAGDPVGLVSPVFAKEKPLKAGDIDPETGKKIKYWAAPMDPAYIRYEPGKSPMGMDLVPVFEEEGGEKEPLSTIRIDPITMQNMGVRTDRVQRRPLVKEIRAYGDVTYNERRMTAVSTKFNGWIERLYVDFEGERVRRGQPLFEIYSPEVVTAQEEYLLALEQYRRFSDSPYEHVRESARRLLDASRTRLRYWDLRDAQIRKLETEGRTGRTITVYAPSSGVVTQKNAVVGHYVKAGDHQYEIADLSDVWVDVDVYEYELPWVREGMAAVMDLPYLPGKQFRGKVLYVYPYLNPKTRTARLRLLFPNSEGLLKPAMYANVRLASEIQRNGLVIPQEAVIDNGVRKIVFVLRGKGRFEPREVRLGPEISEGRFQVLDGLTENEEIVISAQFMLDSESRLKEAVQKMLEARKPGNAADADPNLNMDTLQMDDDDLSMDGLTMDTEAESRP